MITLPSASYFHGRPPSATCVPPPVAVKKAGMPEPPARIRSAKVPCGVSSTSSSPERYWRANSLFSPTYDEIIRRSRFSISSRPRPHWSTPQLSEPAWRSVPPASSTASISTDGTPHSPNPPTASVAPSGMSPTASAALATTLSIPAPPGRILPRRRGRTCRGRSGSDRVLDRPHLAAEQDVHRTAGRAGSAQRTVGRRKCLPLRSVVPAQPVAPPERRHEDRYVASHVVHEHQRPARGRLGERQGGDRDGRAA